jgi:hypothetical protein
MRKKTAQRSVSPKKVLLLLFLLLSFSSYAQKIKLFVDCSNTWCDLNYVKTEINFVDFVLDNKAADVHALITSQNNGGGGSQYQLIFFGQNNFKGLADTLRFTTKANDTDFEIRNYLVKYLQLGLVPFITRTKNIENISFTMKENVSKDSASKKKRLPKTRGTIG